MFSPDGARVVTASGDGAAQLWDAASRELLATSEGHGGALYSAAFSPDGAQVVTASHDGIVRLWDAITFRAATPQIPLTLRAGIRSDSVERQSDALGVQVDAQAFARLIADRGIEPPLAIGVFGEWGSGKSFFMRLLREEIESIAASGSNAFCSRIVQIEFNAWHYVEANLWASLVDHILISLDRHFRPQRSEVERIFAGLETAPQLKAEAEADRAEAEAERRHLAEQLKSKRDQVERSLSFSRLLRKEFWQDVPYDELPEEARARIDAFRGQEEVTRLTSSGRDLWHLVNETQSLLGRARVFWREAQKLPRRKLALAGGLAACVIGLVALISLVDVQSWQGSLTKWAANLAIGVVALAGFWRWALGHARGALALAEHLRDQLVSQNEAELEGLRVELRQAEGRVAEASARIAKAEALSDESNTGRRIARFIEERVAAGDYQKRLGIVATVRRDFEALSDLMLARHTEPRSGAGEDTAMIDRVVLYIDDLDRCPTAKVIQVLEATHLLLAFPLFVVVVGLDVRWASRSLLEHYPRHLIGGDPQRAAEAATDAGAAAEPDGAPVRRHHPQEDATPHDYLEKIFQN